jgi:hypothetical protein
LSSDEKKKSFKYQPDTKEEKKALIVESSTKTDRLWAIGTHKAMKHQSIVRRKSVVGNQSNEELRTTMIR